MDLFTLDRSFKQGDVINRLKTKIWTDRYRNAGDFKVTSEDIPYIRNSLPLNSLVSHTDTDEVMIVEDHEIEEPDEGNPFITVTGRSFESFLEQRIARPNQLPPENRSNDDLNQYVLDRKNSWDQAVQLIRDHIIDPDHSFWGEKNVVPNVACYSIIDDNETTTLSRIIDPGELYPELVKLLAVADVGIKIQRPRGSFTKLNIIVHNGRDVSESIVFSAGEGDLEEPRYFWSIRKSKNASFAMGKYDTAVYIPGESTPDEPTGLDLRWTYVDALSVEDNTNVTKYNNQIDARARQGLADNRETIITTAKISKNNKLVYNRDYFIGDIVGIIGSYNVEQTMRITEFTWSEDETTSETYPTLSPLDAIE